MWCKVCNMETNEHVCPVCGTNTVEDIPKKFTGAKSDINIINASFADQEVDVVVNAANSGF